MDKDIRLLGGVLRGKTKPLSGYFEERRGCRGGKELLSEKSAVPPLIEEKFV